MIIPVDPACPPDGLLPYTHLKDVQLRSKWETEAGVFLAESWEVIERATEAGFPAESLLVSTEWARRAPERIAALVGPDIPVYTLPEAQTAAITGFRVHRGAMAVMKRQPLPSVETVQQGASLIAIIEDVVDHTNVGAIFRNAAALGVDAILVSPSCSDPLYRRSVRVSMGSVFKIPWTRLEAWPDRNGLEEFEIWALTPGGEDIRERPVPKRLALVLGSEGPGLKERTLNWADRRISIPMAHGVDSLNVATAAAVAFWAVG